MSGQIVCSQNVQPTRFSTELYKSGLVPSEGVYATLRQLCGPTYERNAICEGCRHTQPWVETHLRTVQGMTDTESNSRSWILPQDTKPWITPEEMMREVYQAISDLGFVQMESKQLLSPAGDHCLN